MSLLRIGLIKKVHGLRGEVKVLPLTDDPRRFKKLKNVFLTEAGNEQNKDQNDEATAAEFKTEHSVITPKEVILKLNGIDTVETAQGLIGRYICVEKSSGVPLGEWEFYSQDIIGCRVMFGETDMGEVIDLLNCGANDNMLIATNDGREIYYPFVRTFIENVDIEKKLIVINQTEDFFDI